MRNKIQKVLNIFIENGMFSENIIGSGVTQDIEVENPFGLARGYYVTIQSDPTTYGIIYNFIQLLTSKESIDILSKHLNSPTKFVLYELLCSIHDNKLEDFLDSIIDHGKQF